MQRYLSSFALLALACVTAAAQDTRVVTEPTIPPSCTTLDARLSTISDGTYNTLAPTDESKLDTDRIQKAIDSCGQGKAVVLHILWNSAKALPSLSTREPRSSKLSIPGSLNYHREAVAS
jgi:hypothetical protein